ncbi:uncharacterized protein LOC131245217 isoform X2 [Magnolia sinica]|uniref:uncharacterized protein LOC131245217 isoform X2 n=1 Tax=Magnolia sinica TaxID=86752 RepID=UPI002658711E|nr:uncharacterized protein LOC131245217 isoform X2 [Magnolia sinica]
MELEGGRLEPTKAVGADHPTWFLSSQISPRVSQPTSDLLHKNPTSVSVLEIVSISSIASLSEIPKMPFCDTSEHQKGERLSASGNGIKIFYRRYGYGKTKVLLIIGLAGTHDSWGPQIKGLTGTEVSSHAESLTVDENLNGPDDQEEDGIEVCAFDNRGMGRSSVPTKKSEYTTTIMAKDALALMDHLGWRKAHVFGHSMGAMIACKLAAMAPDRISSLALLNVTGGGFECFPKIDKQMISIAIRFLRARTPEQRAAVDLDTHYTKEYVKNISSTGMQSNYGFEGQVNACWTHKMTSKEIDTIRSARFLISVIHGRFDIIAQIYHAKKLAKKLQPAAQMVDLHGGHLVSHERPEEVNAALMELIKASESNLSPQEWSNLPKNSTAMGERLSLSRRNSEGQDRLACIFDVLAKMQIGFVYLFGFLMMAFEQAGKFLTSWKPVRVGSSIS